MIFNKSIRSIEFVPTSSYAEEYIPMPNPAKVLIPDWYKKIPNSNINKTGLDYRGKIADIGVKACVPFLDSFCLGYIQCTWRDISVLKGENGELSVSFGGFTDRDFPILHKRDKIAIKIDKNTFYEGEFVWHVPWMFKTPQNYSSLVIHPLNRTDLPFYTLSGAIDSDSYHPMIYGNLPFYIKKDFEGLIPKGTPMYQIIPFKRDPWESFSSKYDEASSLKQEILTDFFAQGMYKKSHWKKKEFN